jgi:hypothetical protein
MTGGVFLSQIISWGRSFQGQYSAAVAIGVDVDG